MLGPHPWMAIETKEREDLAPFAFVCLYLSDDVDS
jgi:hypothetical protein